MIVLLNTMIFFIFQYHFDNKYTFDSPVGKDGIVDLTDNSAINMLTYGWEIYIQKIVAPTEIQNTPHDEIVYIGQYNDLAFHNGTLPHGFATYHLKAMLPSLSQTYAMEIPEIYSASRVYINNQLMWNQGNIENYKPAIQTGVIMFEAKDSIDITIQVRDENHYYSGVVYPFILGHQDAVMNVLNIRQMIRTFLCAFMFIGSCLILILTLVYRKKEFFYLFIFSFVTCIYLSYPFYHQFGFSILSYQFEDCCYFLMIALIVQLHCYILNLTLVIKRTLAFICGLFIMSAFILPTFFYQNSHLMNVYSFCINAYKCILFVWMITTSLFLFQTNEEKTKVWFIDISIFLCALFMNVFFPLFEPVYGLWQVELAAVLIAISLSYIFIKDTIYHYYQNIILDNHIQDMKKQFQLLNNHYQQMQKTNTIIHQMKHDMRHHILILKDYNQNHNYESLALYLEELSEDISVPSFIQVCDHAVFNAVMHYNLKIAKQGSVSRVEDKGITIEK